MDTHSSTSIISFLKKNIALIVVIVLLLTMLLGGGYGYKYHKQQLKPLDSLKTVLKNRDIEETFKIQIAIDSVQSLNNKEKTFYDEYIREKKMRMQLTKKLASIANLSFDKQFLDSLADNIQYREP